jgi:outer membrane immunogenic protein
MKVSGIATALLGALAGTPALAADLALKAPPLPPPTWTWTGVYIGVAGGGAFGRDPVVSTTGGPPFVGSTVTTINPSGGIVGGTIGYNYQISRFVVGIENDISWNGLQGTGGNQPPFAATFSNSVRGTWLDTLRGRVGITVDRALVYATGGAAFAGIQDSVAGPGVGASLTNTVTGWTVGGGVEYLFLPNWSVKVEYLFVQFPTSTDPFNTFPPPGAFAGVTTHLSENIVRAGINWHFNLSAPPLGH